LSHVEREFIFIQARRVLLCGLGLLLPLCTLTDDCSAQWKKVFDFGRPNIVEVVTFNKWGVGFLGLTDRNRGYTSSVWKTLDTGQSWVESTISLGINQPMIPNDFTFKDSLTGWMSSNSIFKTTDGGSSWSSNFFIVASQSIYYNPATKLLLDGNWYSASTSLMVSSDEGAHWNWNIANADADYNGFSFLTDSIGIITSGTPDISPGLVTRNGGLSWSNLGLTAECWQPFAQSMTGHFFAAHDANGDIRAIYRSDDTGISWKDIYDFSGLLTGCIRGDTAGNLYVQSHADYDQFPSMHESTDSGNTWINICGPGNTWDTRFCVFSHYLFAGDTNGNLWQLDLSTLKRGMSDTNNYIFSVQEVGDTVVNPGDSIGVSFVPGTGTLAATDSVELTLRYDPNAVSLSSLTVPAGWWVADSSSLDSRVRGNDIETLTLTLRSDSAESLPSPLLHAEFHTYLTPSESRAGSATYATFIYLDSAQSFFPQTTPCAATTLSLQQPDSVEIDFTGCEDSTIVAAMEHAPPFTIESVVPNPAASEIEVRISGAGYVVPGIDVQLFDALGNCVLTMPGVRRTALPLDVSSFPSGVYFLRLSENGYTVSRSISIEH